MKLSASMAGDYLDDHWNFSDEKSKYDNFENMIQIDYSPKKKDKSSVIHCQIDLFAKGDDELDVDETDERTGFENSKNIRQLEFKARLSNTSSNNSKSSGVKRTDFITSTMSKSSGKSDELQLPDKSEFLKKKRAHEEQLSMMS